MNSKASFVQFALECNVLQFGEFTLKSGRVSPYFFNAGLFNSGSMLARLGEFYAQRLLDSGIEIDMLFGPAYKGIPIATATAIAYARRAQRDLPVAFNRKEEKDHGEGGSLMGAPLSGRVAIVDDVITAGTAVREAVQIIKQAGGEVVLVLVALDRQEKGPFDRSAVEEVEQEYGVDVLSVATLDDLIDHVDQCGPGWANQQSQLTAYRRTYGIK